MLAVPGGNPRPGETWLFTLCRNRALDILRKDRRLSGVGKKIQEFETDAGILPDDRTQAGECGAELMRPAKQLPLRRQEVLRLKFVHDVAYGEISATTGLTVGNVGFVLHTALKTLRRWPEPQKERL